MATAPRIHADELRRKLAQGNETMFVCAYDDPAKCKKFALDGSMTFQELEAKLPTLPKSQEIVFFCA